MHRLVEQAERGTIEPVCGIVKLEKIPSSPARFGTETMRSASLPNRLRAPDRLLGHQRDRADVSPQ
ncbi:MAG: hypothetical protein ACM3ML_00755 [Micromonosporaceae bacterium]